MPKPLWQLLLDLEDSQRALNISCEECFMILEFYADQLAGENNLKTDQPSLKRHLARCPNCRSKFADWIKNLEKQQP